MVERVSRRTWLQTAAGTALGLAAGFGLGASVANFSGSQKTLEHTVTTTVASLGQPVQTLSARDGLPVAVSAQYVPDMFASYKGFWKKFALDAQVIPLQGGPSVITALNGGQVDFFHSLAYEELRAIETNGMPLKLIAQTSTGMDYVLVGSTSGKTVKSADDLRGKRVGVTAVGSATNVMIRRAAVKFGLDPDKDIITVPLGGLDAQLTALRGNQTDMFVWSTDGGLSVEEKQAGSILFYLKDILPDAGGTFFCTSQDLIDKNPALITRFLRAFFYTLQYMHDNQSEVIAFAADYLKLSKEHAQAALDVENFKVDGTISSEMIMAHQQVLIDAKWLSKNIPLDNLIDQRWLVDKTPILP